MVQGGVLFSLVLSACNQQKAQYVEPASPQTSTRAVPATTTSSVPFLSESYSSQDWRFIDYIFFYVQQQVGEDKVDVLIESIENKLRFEQRTCLTDRQVKSFDLKRVAEVLDGAVRTWLTQDQLVELESRLKTGAPLTADEDEFGDYSFPDPSSPVSQLLRWWLTTCGDDKRGTVTTTIASSTQPPSMQTTSDAPRSCSYYWQMVGEQYLPSRCSVVSKGNCRVIFQEQVWDPNTQSFKIRSQFTLDVVLKDGTEVLAVRYTYMTPCS